MTTNSTLKAMSSLVGAWTTEATHPMVPGVIVHGSATIEWLEGKRFLIIRARTDHPDFPDSISILGFMEADRVDEDGGLASDAGGTPGLRMHYFDSRGVFRVCEASVDATSWRWWRDAPGFSQRFTGTFADDGRTIVGRSQLRREDDWADDLAITYRRED
ncbi:MAG: hypothetical protein ABI664_00485 [bacterium]